MANQRKSAVRLTRSRLVEVLNYDADVGKFYRNFRAGHRSAGAEAGTVAKNGYVVITIDGEYHLAHRLAWLYSHGEWPLLDIDHINGERSDNRICNLRGANRSQNNGNSKLSSRNTSGTKGVCWSKARCKWQAQIAVDGSLKYLGQFDDICAAEQVYKIAAENHFGDFAMHLSRRGA